MVPAVPPRPQRDTAGAPCGTHERAPGVTRPGADILAAVAIAALAILTWWYRIIAPATITLAVFGSSDFFNQIYPMAFRAAAWLRSGVLPLWNPYQYCGHPFLATGLYGVLYPGNVFYLLLPTAVAIEAVIVIHLIAAGLFTYVFAREVGLGRLPSVVAAITFMLSGFMMEAACGFSPALSAAVWLPLALFAVERTIVRPRVWSALLLALAIAMSFLAGWPQTWLYTMWVVAAYVVFRLLPLLVRRSTRSQAIVAGALIAFGGLLALCLMAPQLLPGLELQGLGPRRGGALSTEQQLVLGELWPFLLLYKLVDSTTAQPRIPYFGVVALLLIAVSVARRDRRGLVLFLWLLFAFAICAALTHHTPVFALYNLLGGKLFRAPPRVLFINAFAGAMLAGIGFEVVARLTNGRRNVEGPPAPRWPALTVATVFAIVLVTATPISERGVALVGAALVVLWGAALAPAALARRTLLGLLAAAVAGELFWSIENNYLHPFHDPQCSIANTSCWIGSRRIRDSTARTSRRALIFRC